MSQKFDHLLKMGYKKWVNIIDANTNEAQPALFDVVGSIFGFNVKARRISILSKGNSSN